jgi:uncharacterized protein with PIN domain
LLLLFALLQLAQYVAPGHCYKVLKNPVHEQLTEVLQYFKVNLVEENVFSRCQICNCSSFTTLSKSYKNLLLQDPLSIDELTLAEISLNETTANTVAVKKSWTLKTFDSRRKHELKALFADVPPRVAEEIEMFYICDGCHKVYWDGKHLEDVLNGKFKGLLHMFDE